MLSVRRKVQDYRIAHTRMSVVFQEHESARMSTNGFVARCCVRVMFVIQLSRSSHASSWLGTQDDVSGLTCIGYRGLVNR